uniref:Uncharacterized protein n=1 Tax=Elaeophora elaphi TaxID=1147741 RepID=A0A0R3S0U3_9BILA
MSYTKDWRECKEEVQLLLSFLLLSGQHLILFA